MQDGGRSDPAPHSTALPAPIIVTAAMGAPDAAWVTALRTRHFPAERNFLDAHITLFHHLTPSLLGELSRRLAAMARGAALDAVATEYYSLGRGVALRIECPPLLALREELAEAFADQLTPQDRAKPRLHISIQNKVTPEQARATLAELSADFVPRTIRIAGFETHYYRGGPWEKIARYAFRG